MTEKLKDKDLKFEIYQELGECYTQVGRVAEAIAHFEQAAQLNPGSDRPYVGLGVAALQDSDCGRAQAAFERALSINPQSDRALCGLGMILSASGNGSLPTALARFREALEVNPENLTALSGLLQAASSSGRPEVSETYLRRYLELHVADLKILYCLAGVCFQQGKYAEAEDALERILVFEPDNAAALELKAELERVYPTPQARRQRQAG